MADKRRPETVLLVRKVGGKTMKVELFNGRHFHADKFDNALGVPIPTCNLEQYYRMRVDGAWFPHADKRMFSKNQCIELIKQAVFHAVK